jgi:hypothetical protein
VSLYAPAPGLWTPPPLWAPPGHCEPVAAAPSYRSGSIVSGGASTTSVTASSLPVGWAAGDLLVAFISGKSGAAFTFNTPTGWTAQFLQQNTNGANRYSMQMFWKVAVAGEANPTWTTAGTSGSTFLIVSMVSLIDAVYLAGATSYILAVPTNVAQTCPTITVAAQSMVLLSAAGFSRGATTLNVGGTGGYTRLLNLSQGSTGGVQAGLSTKTFAAANPASTNWSAANGGDMQQWHAAFGEVPKGRGFQGLQWM